MSASPFLPSGSPSRSRHRRRRQPRWRLTTGVLLLSLVLALAAFAMLASGPDDEGHRPAHTGSRPVTFRPPPTRLSAVGLPLAAPSLALLGLGDAASDPVRFGFRHPPRAGILFNLDSGRVLWQRNPLKRSRIASLTKMMTALLVVDSTRPREPVLITRKAVEMPGEALGVLPLHRHVPVETLLYALLLPSANDAAVALAIHVAGSVEAFVARMNAEAARLGMGCTRFSSPSGYYNAHNYSCPADLAMLARADLAHRRLARIASSPSAIEPFPTLKGHKLFLTTNNPLLLYEYPGATGLKTGYTIEAGKCLVGTATRHGVRLGVVLLNSPAPGTQASQLLDRGFERVYHQAPDRHEPEILGGV
jgi:D-alanyl-D-alanine carboxypeptidase